MNIQSGGHLAQVRLMEAVSSIAPVQAVTYQDPHLDHPFLDDLLATNPSHDDIFLIHWGPHIPELIKRLNNRHVVYVSYSTGYDFNIPPEIPILAGSKHTQAYWGRHAPFSPIYHVPCIISEHFRNNGLSRPIDVLVQKRKNSSYVLNELVPFLQKSCSVRLLEDWVEDLALVFNQSKIYLYDSTDHWLGHNLSEGFGLPPLEAMACGCTIFSSLNDALSDYLDPPFNCHQLHVNSMEYDAQRILNAINNWSPPPQAIDPVANYRKPRVEQQLRGILADLHTFFNFQDHSQPGGVPQTVLFQYVQNRSIPPYTDQTQTPQFMETSTHTTMDKLKMLVQKIIKKIRQVFK